ncbi:MAG: glucuronyl esterase domain-containing protein [Promethearchaeota archaeon]|jgi:hypothetical protein
MNKFKKTALNLGFKYMKPRIHDKKIQYAIKDYNLPNPLIFENGEEVIDKIQWIEKRSAEILHLFEENVYGKIPTEAVEADYSIINEDKNDLNGLATRKEVKITLKREGRQIEAKLRIYIPNKVKRPVPAFLGLPNWWSGFNKLRIWPTKHVLQRGYALAISRFGDFDPNNDDFSNGVHPLFYTKGQTRPLENEWGTIGAWAWGLIQLRNYFEIDSDIDQKRIAAIGHSRMGKAALWAGANDERFSMVISNNSGCCGAALFRRKIGETIKRINAGFPHWLCSNFKKFNRREFDLPVDQHMLIALIAPRPVYIGSAQDDIWADPIGEFLGAKYADPVYKLLGTTGLGAEKIPKINEPIMNTIGYHIRQGGHKLSLYDWDRYMDFADLYL